MILVPYSNSSEIMKPCKEAFYLPSSLIWPQLSAILGFCLFSISFVRSNQLNTTLLHKLLIKGIAVICFIPNYLIWGIDWQLVDNEYITDATLFFDEIGNRTPSDNDFWVTLLEDSPTRLKK